MTVNIGIISGYFNPLHYGHIKLFKESKNMCKKLIVIINNDEQQKFNVNKIRISQKERIAIIKAIKYVDSVTLSKDNDLSVIKTLKEIYERKDFLFWDISKDEEKQFIFINGGNRQKSEDIPEYEFCKEHGIVTIFGIGENINVEKVK